MQKRFLRNDKSNDRSFMPINAEVLEDPIYDTKAEGTSRSAIGQTRAGRYVLVIYTRDPEPNSVFVITARELRGKALKAFKRLRQRKKS